MIKIIVDSLLVLLAMIMFLLIGATLHEADMARNYKETGDAKA